MIEVSGLTKTWGQIKALDNVSFRVEKGQIVGFLGANGAGKTTTMDILCGCIGADGGTAKVAGWDIMESPIEAKRRLGYLPDVPPLHLDMKVGEYVEYAARLRKVPSDKIKTRVAYALDQLSLGDVRKRLVGNLSKGYRQRVALAQAIVHDPDVLVLDEPTEGLDPTQIAHIRQLIRSLGGRHTIILSSHILSEVQNTCDKIIIINKGKVVGHGSYEELASRAQGGNIYRLKVATNPDQLVNTLAKAEGVLAARLGAEPNEIEIAIPEKGEAALDLIVKKAIDGGHGLRELSHKTKSLEEVFMQFTK
jgi:ABC-2 type transport system ATP-binding protein